MTAFAPVSDMQQEFINRIEVNKSDELCLYVSGVGKPSYQYIYREAAGVYWDNELSVFKSTPRKSWSYLQWFDHIVSVVKNGLGVSLILSDNVEWKNVPEDVKHEIHNR